MSPALGEARERFAGARIPESSQNPGAAIGRERAERGVFGRGPIRTLRVAVARGAGEQVAQQQQGGRAGIALAHGPLHFQAGIGGGAVGFHRARQRDTLGCRARRQRRERHTDGRSGVVRLGSPCHEPVERVAGPARIAAREREPADVEGAAGLGEGLERAARVPGDEQGARACGRHFAAGRRRHVGEQAKRGGGVARDASLPHPEPRLDHGEAAGARRAIGGGRTVRLTRGLPGEARAYRHGFWDNTPPSGSPHRFTLSSV